MEEVFSQGELYVQQLAGEDKIAQKRIPMAINNQLNDFSAEYLEYQLLFNITSIDQDNRVWISMLSGKPNLIKVIDFSTISIDKTLITSPSDDVFYKNIRHNKNVGLLFLDWETRKRYRLNGRIKEEKDNLIINIQETYGICHKYIQRRSFKYTNPNTPSIPSSLKGIEIMDIHKLLIENANTFFLGTCGLNKKVDASHKGGKPGFVKFINNNTIKIPDYSGNSMFNSLGNIHENPSSGLIFIDYKENKILQLTGRGEIKFNQTNKEDLVHSGNTGRFWLFKIDDWIWTENFNQINWDFIDYSPFNP